MDENSKPKPVRVFLSASVFAIALGNGVAPAEAGLPSQRTETDHSQTFGAKWQVLQTALSNGALGIGEKASPARSGDMFAQFRNIAWGNS
jgi:hypothetical protein